MDYPKIAVPMEEKRKRLGELDEKKFREDVVRTLFLPWGTGIPEKTTARMSWGKTFFSLKKTN